MFFYSLYIFQPLRFLILLGGSFIEWRCGLVYCRKAPLAFPAYVLIGAWVWVIGRLEGLRLFCCLSAGIIG